MLSISGAMTAGGGLTSYFTGAEDYYLSAPGQWQGKGAAMLGLTGVVTRNQFRLLSNGFHPAKNKLLVAGKEIDGKNKKQAGNDLTFSAGKSISIAAVMDPQIKILHERAISKLINHIEQNNIQARQQVNGKRGIVDTHNLTIAKFTHLTSRSLDPQLHTHCFLFNLTKRADSQWRALHNKSIFQNKKALGKLYRNELYRELSKAGYGLEITNRREGFFRIKGVPTQLEEHFSKRRQEIKNKVNDPEFQKKYPNADKSTLYQIAALGTRGAKKQISGKEIKKHWDNEIRKQGFSLREIKSKIEQSKDLEKTSVKKNPAVINQAMETITETESTFTKAQALNAAVTLNFGRYTTAELDQAFRTSTDIIALNRQNGRQFFTTPEMMAIEKYVIDTAKAGIGQRQPIADIKEIHNKIQKIEQKNGWQYTAGQRSAINALATAKDKILIVQGDAGTGKTAAMSAFNNLAKSKSYQIRGLGFTGKSADELEKGAGIKSQTIDSFLQEKNFSEKPEKEIWLVDESSMAGSRHYAAILDRAQEQGTTVVFMGDSKQFQSITAGRMFQDLMAEIGTHAQLTEVMRQRTAETRQIVSLLNRDKYDKAFNEMEKQEKIKEYNSKNDLQRAVVQHFKNASKQGKKSTVVITASNADRQQINSKIKAELVRIGRIEEGTDYTVLSPHNVPAVQGKLASSYKVGQEIQTRKEMLGLKAGQSGKIVKIDHDKNTLTIKFDKNKNTTIDINKYHSRLSAYNQHTINLSMGDRIIFTKNDHKLNIKNGQIGMIKDVDSKGNIVVKTGEKTVKFSLVDQRQKQPGDARYVYKHIDHAYAITAHKSQGATFDNVFYHAPTKAGKDRLINKRSAYVSATRARDNFIVLTDDKKRFFKAVGQDQSKTSISDFEQHFKQQFRLKKIQDQIKSIEKEARSHHPKVDTGMGMGR